MKSINLIAAVAIFVSGAAFGVLFSDSPTQAQVQAEAPLPVPPKPLERGEVGRYQISAFGAGDRGEWGCYRIDTQTGDTWRSSRGGRFVSIRN
jgi:hypothetical protein